MQEDIHVRVHSYGPARPLALVYIDPISGKKKAKSAKTNDWREAERLAGELEKQLRAGLYVSPSKVTWTEFRKQYEAERLPALSEKTGQAFRTAANHLERVLNPDRLGKLTAAVLSRFQADLRKEGTGEVTIGSNLRHLRAALKWAVDQGLLSDVPKMKIPGSGGARCRAVTCEEVDRMVLAAEKARPEDSATWAHYLRGLFASGLRLEESLRLDWQDGPFTVDLTGGRRPAFVIRASAQKSRRDARTPMTRAFYDLLMETPPDQRVGRVFKLDGLRTRVPITAKRVCRIVAAIGEKAGVVVGIVEKRKRDKQTGRVVTTTAKKFATAHDLRRGFCDYWSRRVPASVLMKLARHANIGTTMKFYVTGDCDAIGDMLWDRNWELGNISGNNRPLCPMTDETSEAGESTETVVW